MKNCFLAMLAAVGMVMVGCGGDSGSGNSGEHNDTISNDVQKLPNGEEVVCDDKMEGAVVKTADDGYYKCANGDWVKISKSEALKADFILGVTDDKDVRSSSSIEKEPVSSDSKPVESSDSEKREESSSSNERVESSSSAMTTLYVCLDGTFVANMENCPSESSSSVESSSSSSVLSDNEESSSIKDGSEYDEITNTLKDLRDGKTYKTVAIGSRVWMAENLNYDYNEGSALSFCYAFRNRKCAEVGRLYQWAAAMDSAAVFSDAGKGCGYGVECNSSEFVRGVCPDGWRLPRRVELENLKAIAEQYAGQEHPAGFVLKLKDAGNDSLGFGSIPTGYYKGGSFQGDDRDAYYWSSTKSDKYRSSYMYLGIDDANYGVTNNYKHLGFAIRCVKSSDDDVVIFSSSSVVSSSSIESCSSAESSSSSAIQSSSSSVIPGSSSSVIPGTDPGSSSSVASSSSVSSSSAESSSSVESSSSEEITPTLYKTQCPAGKICTYAPTEQLNPKITYGELLDTRDYQVYKTVTIGKQIWMAQNLNYKPGNVSSWCYGNSTENCDKYGRLYTWDAAMNDRFCAYGLSCRPSGKVRGICPDGWHLPSFNEFITLVTPMTSEIDYYDDDETGEYYDAGMMLKSQTGWKASCWGSYYSKSSNESGFSALPGGGYNGNRDFADVETTAYFWSASEEEERIAYGMELTKDFYTVYLSVFTKSHVASVRCVKD